jgi:hypothetical protein
MSFMDENEDVESESLHFWSNCGRKGKTESESLHFLSNCGRKKGMPKVNLYIFLGRTVNEKRTVGFSLTSFIYHFYLCKISTGWWTTVALFDGVSRQFQQYFSHIVAVSFNGKGNRSTQIKPLTYLNSLTTFIT